MPVRKIPKNYLGVTGGFASKKNGLMLGFESLLEKEYMLLLEFDESVERFEEQPVSIPIPGTRNSYTPDLLIHYRSGDHSLAIRPCLAEVKHSNDLIKNAGKYAPKFAAAAAYAAANEWDFKTVTQDDIRGPRLANLKFLKEYRNVTPMDSDKNKILMAMRGFENETSFNTILGALEGDGQEKLHWIPVIWHLIVTKAIRTDLNVPFSDNISLWLPQVSNG